MSRQTDRLSHLPDDVLHNILSHLPNTEARARTSLLSKRFLHLWAHHPSVRIGDPQLLQFLSPAYPDSASAATIGRYLISVDRCLASLLCPVLQTLELNLFSTRRSFRWIRSAANRRVRDLRLSADPSRDLKIGISIFYCTSLVSLDLRCCQLPRIHPRFNGFPSLAHLKITGIMGRGAHENLVSLLSKCPSLQSLKLRSCHDLTTLDLTSQSLTDIDIFHCPGLHRVSIDAPNLTSFSYSENVNSLYLENARHLLDANLCHSSSGTDFATYVEWVRLVRSLSHVSKRLRVKEWFFKFLLPETPEPLFGNLKMLHCIVHWVTSPVLNGLAAVLGHCPNLEQLKIDLSCGVRRSIVCLKQWISEQERKRDSEQERKHDSEQEVWDPSELPADVTPSLKTIIVDYFLGTANEMKMLEYLLGRSSVLEKLIIGDCRMRDKEEIHCLLAYIPRASSHVQICVLDMLK